MIKNIKPYIWVTKSVFGNFLSGLKNAFFGCFLPFFSHVVITMILKNEQNSQKFHFFMLRQKFPDTLQSHPPQQV
jgi:hypothetical protein